MSFPRTAALVFVMLLVRSHAEATDRPSSSRDSLARCYAVQVESVGSPAAGQETHARRHRARRRFSAREILDLRFRVFLPSKNQSGLVEIRLYTPKGNLYETLQAELDPENSSISVPRYRFHRARTVTADLPVAGSYITRRSLWGEWRAEVHLDGNERSCTRPTTFTLEP